MDVRCVVNHLIILVLLMFNVDASFGDTLNSTKQSLDGDTKYIHSTPTKDTTWTKHYYIRVYIINGLEEEALLFTNFTGEKNTTRLLNNTIFIFNQTLSYPAIYCIWATGSKKLIVLALGLTYPKISKMPQSQLCIKTSVSKSSSFIIGITEIPNNETINSTTATVQSTTLTEAIEATIKNAQSSTTLSTTKENSSEANYNIKTTISIKTPNAYEHDEHKHKLLFYISVGFGSAFGVLLFSLIIILVRWCIRKRKQGKKRAVYWAKINRTCQSQYITNEEVSTNNPMYEGSRSRTTSNVLYGVPEQDNIKSKLPGQDDILTPPTQRSPQPDLVVSNVCALYQNADELYSEPKKEPECVGNGNYERIKSCFIKENRENSEVRESTGSYAEPCVIFNGIFVSENTGYVSVEHKSE